MVAGEEEAVGTNEGAGEGAGFGQRGDDIEPDMPQIFAGLALEVAGRV